MILPFLIASLTPHFAPIKYICSNPAGFYFNIDIADGESMPTPGSPVVVTLKDASETLYWAEEASSYVANREKVTGSIFNEYGVATVPAFTVYGGLDEEIIANYNGSLYLMKCDDNGGKRVK